MKRSIKNISLVASFTVLSFVSQSPDSPIGITAVPSAKAVIGVPVSPASYAGVARRHTRRAVAVTSSAAASSAAASSAQKQETTQAAPPPQSTGSLPVGAVVSTVPTGCTSFTKDNAQYYTCQGNYYRAAFQGNNLVYTVVPKP